MPRTYGDRWETVSSLDEGGQGITYLVKDLSSPQDTRFVLKRLRDYSRIERFEREIEAIKSLDFPNIVQIVDYQFETEPAYLVTEYCEGGNLLNVSPYWLDNPVEALNLFEQVCEAVHFAHSRSIIHRDIKPANIFLRSNSGPAVLGDFGLCFIKKLEPRITETAEVVGPRTFIAPELEDGRLDEVSPKCDIYSLGKLLYWLLSGGRVFSREKHREPQWDLKKEDLGKSLGWENIYMEHVNRLLDRMIVLDPDQRRSSENILILARWTKRLIQKEFNPVSMHIKQQCTYCGQGYYTIQARNTNEIDNQGITPRGNSDWRAFVCKDCGHVQFFRVDIAKRKEWWD